MVGRSMTRCKSTRHTSTRRTSTRRKSIGRIVATALVASAAVVGTAQAQTATPTVLKLGYAFPQPDLMPLFVARQQGCLDKEGLKVETLLLSSGDKITFALIGGSLNMAAYTPDWFIRSVERGGANLKLVLQASNLPVYSLIVSPSVASYKDLKGKRLGVSAIKSSDAFFIKKMMAANGLPESSYTLIPAGQSNERASALRAGSIAGTLLFPPLDQRFVDEEKFKRLDVTSSVIKNYAWKNFAVREDWAKANKQALVGFIKCWIAGARWTFDPANAEAAIGLMMKETKLSEAYARTAYQESFTGPMASVRRDGEMDPVGLQILIEGIVEQGDLPASPSLLPAKFIDASYWEEARRAMP
jgi:NitT/TauT family transport system substrate-binding protein